MQQKFFVLIFALSLFTFHSFGDSPNLLPNGDVENEFLNLLTEGEGYITHIKAKDTLKPNYWRLSKGAEMRKDVKYTGNSSIRLQGREKEVSATIFSDYWRVKDASMPFGLPLAPGRDVRVSFFYKTSADLKDGVLKATITLGTIADLPSTTRELVLPSSSEWRYIEVILTPPELRWGAQVSFTLAASLKEKDVAWIDHVRLTQDPGDFRNLVRNPSFEETCPPGEWPLGWLSPTEDQWVSWVGDHYRRPLLDVSDAESGRRSLRATVTYADVSGISQVIWLNQSEPRPVIVGLWSKLDNSIGNRPPYYYGSDNLPNLIVYVYHMDGTMQEVSPTLCLGESDHDWDYRRIGFLPQKPVKKIRIQVTVIGTEPTTSLWLDDVNAFELTDSPGKSLPSEENAPPRTLSCAWGRIVSPDAEKIMAANDGENLYLSIPALAENRNILVYLNTNEHAEFINYYRYYYDVIRISKDGSLEKGKVTEKQGYIAIGQFVDRTDSGLVLDKVGDSYVLTVPFRSLNLDGVPETPIGFNVQWNMPSGPKYWTGDAVNTDQLGALIPAPPRRILVRSLRFGNRYDLETDQSQDFWSYPPIYAGMNEAELCLVNPGKAAKVEITAGIRGENPFNGSYPIASNETKTISFPYNAGVKQLGNFDLSLRVDGVDTTHTSYPIEIPPAVEIVLDQEFYFPEEKQAVIEIRNGFRPILDDGTISLIVKDLVTGKLVYNTDWKFNQPRLTLSVPLDGIRINDLPIQDYQVTASYCDAKNKLIDSQSVRFGRIHHTKRRPLPPIKKLRVDDKGRIIINDNFRFFPVVPSVNLMDWHDAIDLGANMYRAYLKLDKDKSPNTIEETEKAWTMGVYTMTIGPFPEQMDAFEKEAGKILSQPGFLGCYGKQFYYWKLPKKFIEYRKNMERIIGKQPSPRLVIWGHHDSSFLYDRGLPPWPIKNPPVGYCYVKIMGRPGSAWRNSPFLTLTEQVLDPHKFKMAEVNYYVSFHDDEIVPEHFMAYFSIRADDWRGLRNESYLSIIYGANGLYHWICAQKGGLQRLRGWFQELNFMWPIFVADDADAEVSLSPVDSLIEMRLKKWHGKFYLLTANASEATQHATLQINGFDGMKVRKLFDLPGEMKVTGNTLTDTWHKYDTFVYEIALPR